MAMQHEALTAKILEAAFEVSNELGAGYLESVYAKSLFLALCDHGLKVSVECPVTVSFKGRAVGQFYADLVVEGIVVVELKAVKELAPEHEAQLLNYLKATGMSVGMLLNFGQPKLQFRRYENRFNKK